MLEAGTGAQALKIWQELGSKIDLLLTDLVLPDRMSGLQLTRQLQVGRPKLRVLFMSGYSAEMSGREFEFEAGRNFLQKPFSAMQLLETVRRALEDVVMA